jgi:hypothetical protein
MNNKIFLVGLVFAVFFLSGCTDAGLGTAQMKDCGNDEECFTEALVNCQPAKFVLADNEAEVYSEIRGGTTQMCTIYTKYLKATFLPELEGKEMECQMPVEESALELWAENITGLSDMCTGSLVEEMEKMSELYGDIELD